ncbi:SDR family oxidoreductase [Acinetobacter stercoris]|uniref:3-oxoacyl-[acyl-carrier-protein] reductase FabG n=1 Tax=Acinetobacter stercoris TaxID=2126983 RepID=A0A2U3N2M3_9GAMM|nr:SDR family oxidoreductase [Acinetobacter stercoris]SPL71912.1 3-oxoacyl-[acyl-carrier-protein] reductase FabG [Acinetobacter stercoris]
MTQKYVLVTGATKGIGKAICTLLDAQGFHPIGIARHTENIKFSGTLFPCDLSDIAKTETVLKQISSNYEIYGIVNNAGIASPQALGEIQLDVLQQVLDLNVRTAIQVTQHFTQQLKNQQNGRIINICSRAIYGSLDRTAYSAAKSALVGCTRTWALELAEYGITSNAVAPGPIETELFRKNRPVGSDAEAKILNTIPMHKLGTPEDVAYLVNFLLSEQAGYITGQVISVDGGGSIAGRS